MAHLLQHQRGLLESRYRQGRLLAAIPKRLRSGTMEVPDDIVGTDDVEALLRTCADEALTDGALAELEAAAAMQAWQTAHAVIRSATGTVSKGADAADTALYQRRPDAAQSWQTHAVSVVTFAAFAIAADVVAEFVPVTPL